jgi:hypothetical protein
MSRGDWASPCGDWILNVLVKILVNVNFFYSTVGFAPARGEKAGLALSHSKMFFFSKFRFTSMIVFYPPCSASHADGSNKRQFLNWTDTATKQSRVNMNNSFQHVRRFWNKEKKKKNKRLKTNELLGSLSGLFGNRVVRKAEDHCISICVVQSKTEPWHRYQKQNQGDCKRLYQHEPNR